MTESAWLTCTDPKTMLEFLEKKASERKLRLFAVACVRRVWRQLNKHRSRRAVEVVERYADSDIPLEKLEEACESAWDVISEMEQTDGDDWPDQVEYAGAYAVAQAACTGSTECPTSVEVGVSVPGLSCSTQVYFQRRVAGTTSLRAGATKEGREMGVIKASLRYALKSGGVAALATSLCCGLLLPINPDVLPVALAVFASLGFAVGAGVGFLSEMVRRCRKPPGRQARISPDLEREARAHFEASRPKKDTETIRVSPEDMTEQP